MATPSMAFAQHRLSTGGQRAPGRCSAHAEQRRGFDGHPLVGRGWPSNPLAIEGALPCAEVLVVNDLIL